MNEKAVKANFSLPVCPVTSANLRIYKKPVIFGWFFVLRKPSNFDLVLTKKDT